MNQNLIWFDKAHCLKYGGVLFVFVTNNKNNSENKYNEVVIIGLQYLYS